MKGTPRQALEGPTPLGNAFLKTLEGIPSLISTHTLHSSTDLLIYIYVGVCVYMYMYIHIYTL